jgi:hypothetical protein
VRNADFIPHSAFNIPQFKGWGLRQFQPEIPFPGRTNF